MASEPRLASALLALLATTLLIGCDDGTGLGSELVELQIARAVWVAEGPSDYKMTLFRGCECLPEMTGPVELVVRDGFVESRECTNTGGPVGADYADLFPHVDGLFDLIEEAVRQGASKLRVSYHPSLGYPLRISIDYLAQVADDEVTYVLSELEPL